MNNLQEINIIDIIKVLQEFGDALATQHFPKIKNKFPNAQKIFGQILIPLDFDKHGHNISINLSYLSPMKGNNDVEICIMENNKIIDKTIKHVPIYPDVILNHLDNIMKLLNCEQR